MRASTVISVSAALFIAGVAAYGARTYLNEQVQSLLAASVQENERTVDEAPQQTIVIADKALAFGARIEASAVREIPWGTSEIPEGSFAKIEDLIIGEADEEARFAVASIQPGEPILSTKITMPGQRAKLSTALTPGKKAISIRVNDVLGVAGFVLPGDRVDVMLTRNQRDNAYVDVLLQGVRVLAIDQIADERKDNPSVVRTVTFEVGTEEAQKLTLAANVGTLSLALRNFSSADVEEINRVTLTDLSDVDVAESLKEEIVEVAKTAQDDEKIEQMISDAAANIFDRLDQIETSITEKEKVALLEERASLSPNNRVTVGVIRSGKRSEYSVNQ